MTTHLLPPGAQHVQDFLRGRGSLARVQVLAETAATAQDAARALNVSVSQIGKSIVFGSGDTVLVVVVCGDQRVDNDAISRLVQSEVKPLRADAIKHKTGYSIGGVSPFGLPSDVTVIVDIRLHKYTTCYVAAGHPKAVVRTNGKELVDQAGAKVADVSLDF